MLFIKTKTNLKSLAIFDYVEYLYYTHMLTLIP